MLNFNSVELFARNNRSGFLTIVTHETLFLSRPRYRVHVIAIACCVCCCFNVYARDIKTTSLTSSSSNAEKFNKMFSEKEEITRTYNSPSDLLFVIANPVCRFFIPRERNLLYVLRKSVPRRLSLDKQ